MPQTLLPTRALAIAASLQLELSQDTIVHCTGVSLHQVQRMKYDLVVHGFVQKSNVVQQGWKSKTTPEMEEVNASLYHL